MKVNKVLSDQLEACYSVARLQHGEDDYLLVASEVEQACFAYNVNQDFEKSLVWDSVGGTMSIIQIPDTMDFLATQKFYPGFNASSCQIVYGKFVDAHWEISKVCDFPYLHRFDLIKQSNGIIRFIGCTIANSKQFVEDWSDKGKIFVGLYDAEQVSLEAVTALPLCLLKNHGYYDVKQEGYSLITAVEGVVKLTYPEYSPSGDWRLDILFGEETSDVVRVDLDGDGHLENLIIQGFHGDRFRIFNDDFSKELYANPDPTEFGHAIWSGTLLGEELALFGWRAGKADLLVLGFENGAYKNQVIDAGSASSNVLAFEKAGHAYVFSANNGRGEVALYELSH